MKDGFLRVRAISPEINVADVRFNTARIIRAIWNAEENGVKILSFPELSVCAYTCADLFFDNSLISACEGALDDIRSATEGKDIIVFVGAPLLAGTFLFDCAVAISNGKILGAVPKTDIVSSGDAYEGRYFKSSKDAPCTVSILGKEYPFGTDLIFSATSMPSLKIACEIGSDITLASAPSMALCEAGANVIVNLASASEIVGRADFRRLMCKSASARGICAYIYADSNENESTTDSVYSAHNIICQNGKIIAESLPFEKENGEITTEIDVSLLNHFKKKSATSSAFAVKNARVIPFDLKITDTALSKKPCAHPFILDDKEKMALRCDEILTMQSRALAKRLKASHSKTAVLGISGGLDSTLALLVTVRAFDYLKWDRKNIFAITMPCFGTTERTKSNATELPLSLGISFDEINIFDAVKVHFKDIGHDESVKNVAYENAQARERTQILMDYANDRGGIVVGTGDLSEIALGWSTYNGDQMSMYNPNCDIPKTLVKYLVSHEADKLGGEAGKILNDIVDTPVSPELLPPDENGKIAQKTEDLVGPYDLHDFFLYNFVRYGYSPSKILRLATLAFEGAFDRETIKKWLEVFIKRFFTQQFKRSSAPDGVKVGAVALSQRADLKMPSDASYWVWLDDLSR